MDSDTYSVGGRRPGCATVVLVSALTSALVSVATVVALTRYPLPIGGVAEGKGTVKVPQVVGLTSAKADETLRKRKLRLVVLERRPDANAPDGTIMEQTPMQGSRVDEASEVAVVVSSGSPRIAVPNVIGKPVVEAQRLIEEAGLKSGAVSETGTGAAGTVTATEPAVGAVAQPGQPIALTAAPNGTAVPEVVGKPMREAKKLLEAAGFVVGETKQRYDGRKRAYVVLEQTPVAGASLPKGGSVDLVVNEGDD